MCNWNTGRGRQNEVEEIFEVIMADGIPKLTVDSKILLLEDQRP